MKFLFFLFSLLSSLSIVKGGRDDDGTKEAPIDHTVKSAPDELESHLRHEYDVLYKEAISVIEDAKSSIQRLEIAIKQLEQAADMGNKDAATEAVRILFFGNAAIGPDYDRCGKILEKCSDPECFFLLGLFHAQSLGGKERDPARTLAYYGVAAQRRHHAASMALGAAYTDGRFVTKSCQKAKDYMYPIAEQMAHKIEAERIRSFPKLHRLINDIPKEESTHGSRDVIEFYQYNAEAGDASSFLFLGQVFYLGIGGIKQDFAQARKYFAEADELGSSSATGYLGQMDLYGEGLGKPDYRSAFHRLRHAAKDNNPIGLNGMGLLYWKGIEVIPDQEEALKYFKRAADLEYPEGNYNYAKIMQEINPKLFDEQIFAAYLTALRGGFVLAGFELAKLNDQSKDSCTMVRFLINSMLEKHPRNFMLEEAGDLYRAGKVGAAISRYMYLAEQGIEAAKINLAYVLHKMAKARREDSLFRRAFYWWSAAADSGDPYALVMTGDYFYYGWGMEEASATVAAAYYHRAMEKKSLQATFNLALLHQKGVGVPRDLPMARRYYEQALGHAKVSEVREAWLPCTLGLYLIRIIMGWERLHFGFKRILRVNLTVFSGIIIGMATLLVAVYTFGFGRFNRSARRPVRIASPTDEDENDLPLLRGDEPRYAAPVPSAQPTLVAEVSESASSEETPLLQH